MKLFSIAVVSAFVAMSASAFAADLPSRSTPAPVATGPSFSWTGFYGGASAGYVSASGEATDISGTDYNQGYPTSAKSAIGSINAGYNYQVGSFVFGAEANIGLTQAS